MNALPLAAVLSATLLMASISIGEVDGAMIDADALVSAVSADAMMATVEALEQFGTREWHTQSAALAGAYVEACFQGLGIAAERQEFEHDGVALFNVVATIPGTDPSLPYFLFGAHYDSENFAMDTLSEAENMSAPGADDDASGIAAVVELGRIISQAGLSNGVKFVAFAAEEYGYDGSGGSVGSSFFVAAEKDAGVEYEGTAILDMIGYTATDQGRAVIVVNGADNAMAEDTARAVQRHGLDLELNVLIDPAIIYSDHEPFWLADYPSMLVIEELEVRDMYPVNPYYHTEDDLAVHLSEDQMTQVTKALLGGVIGLSADESRSSGAYVAIVFLAAASVIAAALAIRFRKKRS